MAISESEPVKIINCLFSFGYCPWVDGLLPSYILSAPTVLKEVGTVIQNSQKANLFLAPAELCLKYDPVRFHHLCSCRFQCSPDLKKSHIIFLYQKIKLSTYFPINFELSPKNLDYFAH